MILPLFEDVFSRPFTGIYDAPLLCFLTTVVVPGKLKGLGQILYVLQNMLVKEIKCSFFANAVVVRYFISLDLEKEKTNLTSECISQVCFPSMCSSGWFWLVAALSSCFLCDLRKLNYIISQIVLKVTSEAIEGNTLVELRPPRR